VLDLSGLREHLAPYYNTMGRPSVDPELMIRALLIGYCLGTLAALCGAVQPGVGTSVRERVGAQLNVPYV